MHLITKGCILFLWMRTLNFVKSQECTLEDFRNSPLYDDNFNITGLEDSYLSGRQVRVSCNAGYTGFFNLVCTAGTWQTRGTKCQQIKCQREDYSNAEIDGEILSEYNYNDRVNYTCKRGYEGSFTLTCEENGWTGSNECRAPKVCGRPPPLSDGDITTSPREDYDHNAKVEYSCANYYTMEGGPYKTCINGEWTGHVRCRKPCTVTREDMNRHNIRFKYSRNDKLYSEHGDEIEFQCTRGRPVHTVGMRSRCTEGVMQLPTCQ